MAHRWTNYLRKHQKVVIAFMCVLAHWTDVGGRYVGSSASNDTTEIFQEGIQFRSVKLRRRGAPVPEIYRMIEFNTRLPDQVLGDVGAQLAGCIKGAALFEELVAKYGRGIVLAAIAEIWRQSEAAARAAVHAIPNGVYHARSFLDNDGVDLDHVLDARLCEPVARRQAGLARPDHERVDALDVLAHAGRA